LNEGLAGEFLAEHSLVNEVRLLGECWKRLATDGAVAYGKEELQKAKEEGAIEIMLISAETLRSEDTINGDSWGDWVDGLSEIGAELVQCSLEHDDGQQLLSFGGAIALLRFKI
jgi:protein pelota